MVTVTGRGQHPRHIHYSFFTSFEDDIPNFPKSVGYENSFPGGYDRSKQLECFFFGPNPETAKNQWLEPEEFQRSCFYVRFTLGGGNSHEVYGILIILTLRTCFENPNPNIQCKQ